MNKQEAYHAFWSSFGWKAYNEASVPDNALESNDNRYITYQGASGNLGQEMVLTASLFHRSTSWVTIHAKQEEISERLERMWPPSVPFDGGRLRIVKSQPFGVDESDEDPSIRRVRLNVHVEYLSET